MQVLSKRLALSPSQEVKVDNKVINVVWELYLE